MSYIHGGSGASVFVDSKDRADAATIGQHVDRVAQDRRQQFGKPMRINQRVLVKSCWMGGKSVPARITGRRRHPFYGWQYTVAVEAEPPRWLIVGYHWRPDYRFTADSLVPSRVSAT